MTQREFECELYRLSLFLMETSSLTSLLSAQPGDQVPIVPVALEHPAPLLVSIAVPESPPYIARIGKATFEAKCPVRNGVDAAGQDDVASSPLRKNCEPSHPGAKAIPQDVPPDVRQHYWPFANLSTVKGLIREDVVMIIAQMRELQQTNRTNRIRGTRHESATHHVGNSPHCSNRRLGAPGRSESSRQGQNGRNECNF